MSNISTSIKKRKQCASKWPDWFWEVSYLLTNNLCWFLERTLLLYYHEYYIHKLCIFLTDFSLLTAAKLEHYLSIFQNIYYNVEVIAVTIVAFVIVILVILVRYITFNYILNIVCKYLISLKETHTAAFIDPDLAPSCS